MIRRKFFSAFIKADAAQRRTIFPSRHRLTRPQVNPAAGSYDFLAAKVSLNLRKFLQHNDVPDLTFSIYGENLLDKVIYFPESTGAVNTLPLRSGIAFFGNVVLRF